MTRATTVGPPMAPLLLSGLALLATAVAVPIANAQQDTVADVAPASALGWVLGVAGLLAFMWFRARDVELAGSRDYAIPKWNPQRVAVAVGIASWLVSLYHAFVIADALARQ